MIHWVLRAYRAEKELFAEPMNTGVFTELMKPLPLQMFATSSFNQVE